MSSTSGWPRFFLPISTIEFGFSGTRLRSKGFVQLMDDVALRNANSNRAKASLVVRGLETCEGVRLTSQLPPQNVASAFVATGLR
jgi:hypothetical protein